MKRLLAVSAVFLGLFLVAPAWAHHPAEGIVTDDIWQMINDMLIEANSPHLDIDFDEVMGSMAVAEDNTGRPLLETSIVVLTEDVDEFLLIIDPVVAEFNRIPGGNTKSGTAATMTVETENLGGGLTQIYLYEPIGSGQSQDDMYPKFFKKG